MARRRPRQYVVRNAVFSVRLRGAEEWEVKTVAGAEASFAWERRYWNGRGYETRVELEDVVTTYPSFDAVRVTDASQRTAVAVS